METISTLFWSLRKRNLIAQVSHEEELRQLLEEENTNKNQKTLAAYCGIDPTASSLHIGNLVPLMLLRRLQEAGVRPIVLFGGATGAIGDPTGRTEMRPMHTPERIAEYIENFKKLARRYFRFDVPNYPIFVNNLDWIGPMSWLDFARAVGVHFTVARLLSAEVNKTRLQQGGLTFMELGYQLLQSYDFLHLYQTEGCSIQVGGDDQWSNILGGADLIRRVLGKKAFAVTTPLLVGSDGRKLGKTAGNTIWLDPKLTPPYEFFQYLRNLRDEDVKKMFEVFTFLSDAEIEGIYRENHINQVKEKMAFAITALVHGKEDAEEALHTSHAFFSQEADQVFANAPTTLLPESELAPDGLDILSLLIRCQMASSRGDARKLVLANGIQLNGQVLTDFSYKIKKEDFSFRPDTLMLRKGKKTYQLVKLKQSED